jgi:biotin carboxyl carrier protein
MTVEPSGLRPGRSASRSDHPAVLRRDAWPALLDRLRLVVTPWTRAPCSARSSRSAVSARLRPFPMTLASVYVHGPGSSTELTEVTRLTDPAASIQAGSLIAPMPAMVITVSTMPGDSVAAGQPLIVLEAMKMQHAVLAPGDGVVAEVRVKEGEQVAAGQVLAVLEAAVTETSDAS